MIRSSSARESRHRSLTPNRSVRQRELRSELDAERALSQQLLESLQQQDAQRLAGERAEAALMLQQRARCPDTLLARRLTQLQREYVAAFRAHNPQLQRAAHLPPRKNTRSATARRRIVGNLLECHLARRLILALELAESLHEDYGAQGSALQLQIARQELSGMLSTQWQETAALTQLQEKLTALPCYTQRQQQRECEQHGYHVLQTVDANGTACAVHPNGALALLNLHGGRHNIDLTLLSEDAHTFPDPRFTITTVASADPSCPASVLFTDLGGTAREVSYLAAIDHYTPL